MLTELSSFSHFGVLPHAPGKSVATDMEIGNPSFQLRLSPSTSPPPPLPPLVEVRLARKDRRDPAAHPAAPATPFTTPATLLTTSAPPHQFTDPTSASSTTIYSVAAPSRSCRPSSHHQPSRNSCLCQTHRPWPKPSPSPSTVPSLSPNPNRTHTG